MMKRATKTLCLGLSLFGLAATGPLQAEENPADIPATACKIGVVDFQRCMEESKFGQQQRNQFMALENQLATSMQEMQRELYDMNDKYQDADYRDSLSPEAERELEQRLQARSQEYMQRLEQAKEMMSQSQMKLTQEIGIQVKRASQIVCRESRIDYVLPMEACFFAAADSEVTDRIISEMDKLYATETGEAVAQ